MADLSEFLQGLKNDVAGILRTLKGEKHDQAPQASSSNKKDELAVVRDGASEKKIIQLQGHDVEVTWEKHLDEKTANAILKSTPFSNWQEDVNNVKNSDPNKPDLYIQSIHFQGVDMFGPRVGFSKFKVAAKKWNEKANQVASIPGIVFMRGGAVGILCILTDATTKREYAVTTVQARVPMGCPDFCEIPAGMLDEERHKFAGKAADEMHEETMMSIKQEDLFDLTDMAYGDKYRGMYPSPGGCDEFIRLFLYRRYMSSHLIEDLRRVRAGDGESEVISIRVVPLEDLWRVAPDAKALSALYLYEKFKQTHPEKHPLPVDEEQEKALSEKIATEVKERGLRGK